MSIRTRLPNWSLVRDPTWPVWVDGLLKAVRKAFDLLWELIYTDFATRPFFTQAGSLTVSGAATTGTYTFPLPVEPDTNYFVTAVPTVLTGGPAAGASQVLSIAKSTTAVVVTVAAAPGIGTSVQYDVAVMRVTV